jgi:hypothetical protein
MRTICIVIASFLLLSVYSYAQVPQSEAGSTTPAAPAQPAPEKDALKFNLNQDGSRYFQFTVNNQTWVRFNENNPGTLVEGKPNRRIIHSTLACAGPVFRLSAN